jgi:hypothetical protein
MSKNIFQSHNVRGDVIGHVEFDCLDGVVKIYMNDLFGDGLLMYARQYEVLDLAETLEKTAKAIREMTNE